MPIDMSRMRSQLILEEGLRLMAYDDATGYPVPPGGTCKGKLTVGVGRNLDANPLSSDELNVVGHDARTQPITHDDAILLLNNDIAHACAMLTRRLPWVAMLDEVRERVLVDMTFNMGIGSLLTFGSFLGLMKAGSFDAAADDLQKTMWYSQVGSRGVRLVGMVRSGEDYTS